MVSKAIGEGNIQAINYFVAQKYVTALESVASARNQKVVLMPLEASGVIGAVAGLTEIAREAFGGDGDGPPAEHRRRGGSVPAAGGD